MIQILNLSFPVKLVSRLLFDINPILLPVSGRLSPHNFEMYSIRPYQAYSFVVVNPTTPFDLSPKYAFSSSIEVEMLFSPPFF